MSIGLVFVFILVLQRLEMFKVGVLMGSRGASELER